MTKTKYMMSEGLAFGEQKDMEKLRRYASQGWHVKRWGFMGYILEKGTPKNVIYTIDHRKLGDDKEEYLELFAATNWEYIASSGDTHLFCANADADAKPIYSDRETMVEKYRNLAQPLHSAAIPLTALTILSWIFTANTTNMLHTILLAVSIFFTVLTIPIVWTTVAAYRLKWQTEGKKGYVTMTKLLPLVTLIAAISTLFITEQNVFIIIAAAIIGAITFPAILSAGLSMYYKAKKA